MLCGSTPGSVLGSGAAFGVPCRDADERVGRQRVEMEGARRHEEPDLVLLDRAAERAFDVRQLVDAVGRSAGRAPCSSSVRLSVWKLLS